MPFRFLFGHNSKIHPSINLRVILTLSVGKAFTKRSQQEEKVEAPGESVGRRPHLVTHLPIGHTLTQIPQIVSETPIFFLVFSSCFQHLSLSTMPSGVRACAGHASTHL